MSWLRSAVNRAVEVSGKNNLTRTVRNYADTFGQAVVEGAKILQDRMGSRTFKSVKLTVKRLEEVAVSCSGVERIQLLRRWLVALKEIERASEGSAKYQDITEEQPHSSDESSLSPKKAPLFRYTIHMSQPGTSSATACALGIQYVPHSASALGTGS
ncbi:hypothetical protein ACLOJK_028078 [Asimina triloba]